MSLEQLFAETVPRTADRERIPVRFALSPRTRRLAVEMAPEADPRDACGLKWQFSCGASPILLHLLRWAMRDSHR
jgi:hypothetical protein